MTTDKLTLSEWNAEVTRQRQVASIRSRSSKDHDLPISSTGTLGSICHDYLDLRLSFFNPLIPAISCAELCDLFSLSVPNSEFYIFTLSTSFQASLHLLKVQNRSLLKRQITSSPCIHCCEKYKNVPLNIQFIENKCSNTTV